jgi:hypothetical protein
MMRISPLVALLFLAILDDSQLATSAPMNICEYNSIQWHLEVGVPFILAIHYALQNSEQRRSRNILLATE